jgi:hypothetical protein
MLLPLIKVQRKGLRKMELNIQNELILNLERLHTTELGIMRIKRNLTLETNDVVSWCRDRINSADAVIVRKGKNWYINIENCEITVNAHSFTIITAHKVHNK